MKDHMWVFFLVLFLNLFISFFHVEHSWMLQKKREREKSLEKYQRFGKQLSSCSFLAGEIEVVHCKQFLKAAFKCKDF